MIISDKLKQIIFKKLYKDLSHVEIIPFNNDIWFIDRENKYWYFEYGLNGVLFWRYDFFNSFFSLFSLDSDDYKSIISEWVEEVLNCKLVTTLSFDGLEKDEVEEVLNCKVNKAIGINRYDTPGMEEVLNCKVRTVKALSLNQFYTVEEVLEL